jgi:hypothetical protein
MGSCASIENIAENTNKKNTRKTVQEQLHDHWNSKSYLKNLYPSLNGNLVSSTNNKTRKK